jgi:DNA polymerase/3'-5' exonuclease PolX
MGGHPYAEASQLAAELRRRLIFKYSDGRVFRHRTIVVGSLRRREVRPRDVDILVVLAPAQADRLGAALQAAALAPPGPGDRARLVGAGPAGPRRRALDLAVCGARYRVDLFLATAAEAPYALYHYTGPWEYNVRVRALAKKKGWRLNQYGLFYAGGARRVRGAAALRTERDLEAFLGVTHRPPARRGDDKLRRI